MIEQQKLNLPINEDKDEEIQPKMLIESDQKPKIRKPRTPFAIFMAENSDKYKNLGKNFLKEIARIWSEQDESVKKIYIDKSKAEKDAIVADMSDMQGSMVLVQKSKFPVHKIKNIVKEDPQLYKKLRPETFEYLSEIVEVFSSDLFNDAYNICKKNNKKKITETIFEDVRKKNYKYRFLSDLKLHDKDLKKGEQSVEKDNAMDEEVDAEIEAPNTVEENMKGNTLLNYFKK